MNEKPEKLVLSSADRAVVQAMADILEEVRKLPGWGDRRDGLILQTNDGREVEVVRHEGTEAVIVRVLPKSA